MLSVGVKFFVVFIPTCVLVATGLWMEAHYTGFGSILGWIIAITFGIAALFQAIILINGLAKINRWQRSAEQRIQELEQRDGELFAQGKSYEEIISQYKKPQS
jgi:hypothetical protein